MSAVSTGAPSPLDARPGPARHYENFPVASVLCPPRLRPAVAAIYWFARTADDIADEGNAPAGERLAQLAEYRAELAAAARGQPASPRWPGVFGPLSAAMGQFALPEALLADLLSAFCQDVERTRDAAGYGSRADLLDYCRCSANPIGRLLLHLYGENRSAALDQSDCICSALQLINFWQDLTQDLPRGRYYLPQEDCARFGVSQDDLLALRQTPQATALIADEVLWARELMARGAPLVHTLPGRAGWELRFVVQGGLRILDRIEASGFQSLQTRPKLGKRDAPAILWKALCM